MNKKAQKKTKKKLKLRKKVVFSILFLLFVSLFSYYYIEHLNIKQIYIKGTTNISDKEIIEAAGIKDYPLIFKLKIKDMKDNIINHPLVTNVSIKRNIFGKITIDIEESKILFFYKYNNKYITSSNESIEADQNYYGYPTLINFTPDTIFDELVKGLNKIDYNVILLVNEMEYNPYKTSDGQIIDETRFTFTMNDRNTVIIDTVNIRNLNLYPTIYTSLKMDKTKGILYLDTISKDTINFRSYAAIKKEEQEALAAEKEKQEKAKEKNKNNNNNNSSR